MDQGQKLRSEGKTLAEAYTASARNQPTAKTAPRPTPHDRAPLELRDCPGGPFKLALAELDRQEQLIAEARAALEALSHSLT